MQENPGCFRSWVAVSDLLCETICARILETSANGGKDALTALTHPRFFYYCGFHGSAFETLTGVNFNSDRYLHPGSEDENLVDLKNYLHDPIRAGRYFVDRGMYRTLSLRIFKAILFAGTPSVKIPMFQYSSP